MKIQNKKESLGMQLSFSEYISSMSARRPSAISVLYVIIMNEAPLSHW